MFVHTKSAMEGADLLSLLARVEHKLDDITFKRERLKGISKKVEDEERKVKADLQNTKHKEKLHEEERMKIEKIKEKDKRFKTAQDKILRGKERMKPSKIQKDRKKKKEEVKKENDSFDEKYFEAPIQ